MASNASSEDFEVVIIGAGFSGIGAAIKLRQAGIDSLVILEQAEDLGGTWRDNTYPGCAVDVASMVYSYSFEPRATWSRIYTPRRELKDYADHCADKYDVRRFIRFGRKVQRAEFDEDTSRWVVHPVDGPPITGRFMVMATGALAQPKLPNIEGLAEFEGKTMHTARWDHEHDLSGRRVAVIGTGASAVQVVPAIVDEVAQLQVYQRTPIWVLPKFDAQIPTWVQHLFAAFPLAQRSVRWSMYGAVEAVMMLAIVYNRQAPWMSRWLREQCLTHLERQVPDPALRRSLTPSYAFGCKRPTFSNDYWKSFMRDDVELVTDSIARITPTGIETVDGIRRDVDTLVLSTGFKVLERGNFPAFTVVGCGGLDLEEFWLARRLQAYQGVTVPRFPNMFMMVGPYGLIGTSFFATMEGQGNHMVRCIRHARRQRATRIEVTQAAHDAYFREIQRRQPNTVFFNGNCSESRSYFFDARGDAPLLRPATTVEHHLRHRFFPLRHYVFS